MNFSNSLAFNSSLTGSGTTINLGSGQLAYTGEGSFSDKLIIATTYEQAIPGGGNILIKAGSKLDLSQVNDLEIQFTAPGLTIDQINKNTKYQLIVAEASGGLVPTSANINFIVNGQEFTNAFVKWSIDTSSLTLSAKDVAEETIDEEFGPGGELENIPNATELEIAFREMENAPNGADAREALNNLGILTPIQRAEAGTHLLQNDTRPGVEASNITTQVVTSNITSNLVSVSARMDKISTGNQTQVKSPVSAGEEDDTSFGVWGSPFVGNSTQKMRNNVNGYKSTPNGGTVGFDALLNDDLVLGVAYTRANTKIKLKDTKVGDKTKVNSNIYSLYGLYNLPNNNWFFSAIASYGDSKMKSYSKRIVAVAPNTPGFQTAIGKYTSKSYTGQVMAGYNYLARILHEI
ncbi:autotransporter outer membrane beta-barrel domain-containing protein [Rickettsia endosymbiont of Polydrusus tereticollis]|uniref:autotransporter outer membrane beta-barrel domain-containing protein n=1 Tax=Rickettsia endosymbiont of Polydrusus tereticollis TaxID=3066251 RepID=UPI00397E3A22